MTKNYPQFEAVKVAIKQDKTGYVLTLSIHPDDLDESVLRDFVGSRYQVVMVRIDAHEQPMNRAEFEGDKLIRIAGMFCKDAQFWKYLYDDAQIFEENEKEATEWMRHYLGIQSRTELKTDESAQKLMRKLVEEFNAWKRN